MTERRRVPPATLPRVGTKPARDFFESWKEINRFFHWLIHMVVHFDEASEHAHKVLVETARADAEREELREKWKTRVSLIEQLESHRQFLVEVILVRHVENYLNYLSGLLFEIFTQRPETLRSSDRIELETVLRHDSIESLVRDMAQRKVESLSYSSFPDLCKYFADRFKLTVASGVDLGTLIEMIEVRNISVHNRCIVNKRFASRTGAPDLSIGKKKQLEIDDLDGLVPLLATRVRVLDADARRRLKVRGARFGAPARANKPGQPRSGAVAST
jgi:hypothetical protein